MVNETPNDFSDNFYFRAIRTRIGEALRTLLIPGNPLPADYRSCYRRSISRTAVQA